MAIRINPIVAKTSSSIYAAAQSANLPQDQVNQLEQFSWAVQKNKKLNQLPKEDARKEFNELDPDIQKQLKFLFPKAEYQLAAPDASDYLIGGAKSAGKLAASPLLAFFKAAGVWNRVINTPYLVARQAMQGEGVFNTQTWTDAWDGRRVFNQESLNDAVKQFGLENVEVAKGLLAGKKPGEIISSTGGKPNQAMLKAIETAFNDPDKFNEILDTVKYAQVSPGRDFGRATGLKGLSGAIDFTYQIIVDPLTWATGGLSALAKVPAVGKLIKPNTTGTQMIKTIEKFGPTTGVRQIFQDNAGVRELWDNGIGKRVRDLANSKSIAERTAITNDIKRNYPGYANEEAIQVLEKNRIFDAKSAERYFTQAGKVGELIAGKTEGADYFRNGIATAKNQRRLERGALTWMERKLNPSFGPADELDKAGEELVDTLIKAGTPKEGAIIGEEAKDLEKFYESITKGEGLVGKAKYARGKTRQYVSRAAVRSPQGMQIKIGKDAIKTQDVFRNAARQVFEKDLADWLSTKFVQSNINEQVSIMRALDYATMQRLGLDGTVGGKQFIRDTLEAKYGSMMGTSIVEELPVPIQFDGFVSPTAVKLKNNVPILDAAGIIHPYQSTGAIAALDYRQLAQVVYENKRKNVISAVTGGATSGALSTKFVDFWSLFTLFPRLGIRSAIDEGFFYYLTAPSIELFNFMRGKGHVFGKMSSAFSGSRAAEGVRYRVGSKLGFKAPSEMLDVDARLKAQVDEAKRLGIPAEQLNESQKKMGQARAAVALFGGKKALDTVEGKDMAELFSLNNQFLTGATRSLTAAASIRSKVDREIAEEIVTPTQFDSALKDLGVEQKTKGTLVRPEDLERYQGLNGKAPALIHFENFIKRFYNNRKSLETTAPQSVIRPPSDTFDPVPAFFRHNGLQTGYDLVRARNELLEQVGLKYRDDVVDKFDKNIIPTLSADITHSVMDPAALDAFLDISAYNYGLLQRGISKSEAARVAIERILLDMRHAFHGAPDAYNFKLMDKIKANYQDIVAKEKVLDEGKIYHKWNEAVKALSFDDFYDVTKELTPRGQMYTSLRIEGLTDDLESMYTKFGNNAHEIMDAQVTGIFRQSAVTLKYLQLRKVYRKTEEQLTRDLINKEINRLKEDGVNVGPRLASKIAQNAEYTSKKFITEMSAAQAADGILKYVDNPNIRTNFAIAVRNTGRFYRATEDFWRRIYRLKKLSMRAVFRMRLAHIGLEANGHVYEDQNGEPYVMMPMDDLIFKTVDRAVRAITPGEQSFKQPMFNDFTFKLRLANPSFAPDAGLPALSGPVGALSVWSMKAILGQVAGTPGKVIGEELDNFALGNIGDNVTIAKAIIPSSLQKLYAVIPQNEKNRQEATAAMQAIAYNAAFATDAEMQKFLDPNASETTKYNYLKNIRLAAHNIVAVRSILGLISPISPSTQESINIPEYLKDVGITGLRPEFYDILNAVMDTYGGVVQDPYELAVATFVGKNPGKLIYTVSREDKQTQVIVRKTKEMKDWAIRNQENIKKYGEAAYIFAPNTGDFNASVYAWMEASDLLKNKTLEKYYTDVLVAEDKQKYYDVGRYEKEQLAATASPFERKSIIESATRSRALLKASNPLLEPALVGGGNEIASEVTRLASIEEILKDISFNIDPGTRQRLALLTSRVRDFVNVATDPSVRQATNFSDIKRDKKEEILILINELSSGDAIVREAARSTFKAILDYYSRNISKA